MDWILVMLAAAGKAIALDALVGSAIGGIVGNRIDAGFVALCEGTVRAIRRNDGAVNWTLRQAVEKALWLAQMSIAQDCLEELLKNNSVQHYRGVAVYQQFPNEIAWLQRSLQEWKQAVKTLVEGTGSLAIGDLSEVEVLLGGAGRSQDVVMQRVRDRLWSSIPADAPQIYVTRSKQAQTGLLERLGEYFAWELQQNEALGRIFEQQILVEVRSDLTVQRGMLQDLTIVSVETLQRMEARFDRLEGMLGSTSGKAVAPSLIVRSGQKLPPNPFEPLTGPVDDVGLFFPRDGLVNRVFELLNAGSSVALIGAAESGKSSLLREIGRCATHRLETARQVVRLDLSQVFGDDDFYTYLCGELGLGGRI